jgi:hypothetical protein
LANPPPPSPAANFSSPSASSFSLPAEKVFLRFAFAVALLLLPCCCCPYCFCPLLRLPLIAIAPFAIAQLLLPLPLPFCCHPRRGSAVVLCCHPRRGSAVVSFAFASAVVCTLSSEPKNRHFDEAAHSLNVRSAMEEVLYRKSILALDRSEPPNGSAPTRNPSRSYRTDYMAVTGTSIFFRCFLPKNRVSSPGMR